uniref:Tyrosine-protein phosphatase domain-containing protein n=1 Tax=Parastrongyloides trichosuri TaxID=131310 RepID=A0A0N5A7E8_PARTI
MAPKNDHDPFNPPQQQNFTQDNPFGGTQNVGPTGNGRTPAHSQGPNERKRTTTNKKTTYQNHNNEDKKLSNKRRSKALDAFVWSVLEKEMNGLKKEYKDEISCIVPEKESCQAFFSLEAKNKNRNPNVPCIDDTRVVIKNAIPSESYIHANFISSLNSPKRFIATQAPLDNTICDFWKIVLQEKVEFIIMLCNFKEKNVVKCAEYFPTEVNGCKNMGDLKISLTKKYIVQADNNIICYKINIFEKKQDHSVKILHWINWPEVGYPSISTTALTLYAGTYFSPSPILVHCSSGIRRTGIWIMIALFMDFVNEGKIEKDFVLQLAKNLRRERAGAIVNDIDYVFIHRLMFQALLDKHIINSSQRLLEFFDDYDAATKKAEKAEKLRGNEMTIGPADIIKQNNQLPGAAVSTPF